MNIQKYNEILKLLDSDMYAAFEELDNYEWGENFGLYNDFKNEYTFRSAAFVIHDFRNRFKLWLKGIFKIQTQTLSYNFIPYLQREIKKYIELADFIALKASETELDIDLYDEGLEAYAKEYYEEEEEFEDNELEEEDTDEDDWEEYEEDKPYKEEIERIIKPTKIAEIWAQVPQMFMRGEAGMGKTTTLEHLFIRELKSAIETPKNSSIPIYFELKDYNGKSLFSQIAKKMGIEEKIFLSAISQGKFSLFLDGLDEVINTEKRNNLDIEMKDEVIAMPAPFIITSRLREYGHNEYGLRVFDLQRLNQDQIREYASKNIDNKSKDIFLNALFSQDYSRLYRICRNIFILKIYKEEVKTQGEIVSKNIGKLLQNFVQTLINRELKKPSGNALRNNLGKYKTALYFLAHELIEKAIPFEYDTALTLLESKLGSLALADDCLNFCKRISLIKGEQGVLKFTHKLYWEYFAAEYILTQIKLNINYLELYINQEKWSKVLTLVHGLSDNSFAITQAIAPKDALTAAISLSSSTEELPQESAFTLVEAEKAAGEYTNLPNSVRGFFALIELGRSEAMIHILNNVKKPSKYRQVIKTLINQSEFDKGLDIILILFQLDKNRELLISWAIEFLDINSTNYDRKKFNLISQKLIFINNAQSWQSLAYISNTFILDSHLSLEKIIENLIEKGSIISLRTAASIIQKYEIKNDFYITKIVEVLINENSISSLRTAFDIIAKYQLKNNFDVGKIVEKLTAVYGKSRLLELFEFMEKYNLQEYYPIENIDKILMDYKGTLPILAIVKFIKKHEFISHIIMKKIIDILINKQDSFSLKKAVELIEKHKMTETYPIKSIVNMLLKNQDKDSLITATILIEKYQLEAYFPLEQIVEFLVKKQDFISLIRALELSTLYQLTIPLQIKDIINQLIKNQDYVSITKALDLIIKHDIYDLTFLYAIKDFFIKNETPYSLKKVNDIIIKWYPNHKSDNINLSLKNSNYPVISIGYPLSCVVSKITKTHVFCKIEGENRTASIYIGEIANEFIPDLTKYIYKGNTFTIGQELNAKVIGIDKENRINLSLKYVSEMS